MPFQLDNVVPWGRSFDEYVRMFSLSDDDLAGDILGCGDGPASFNAIAKLLGHSVVSVDPLYQLTRSQIEAQFVATRREVLEQTERNREQFVWTEFPTIDELERARTAAMRTFLEDYESGSDNGRYIAAELPHLPFTDEKFDLALCSHLLFLYEAQFSLEQHLEAIREMARVASQVRVFPLVSLRGDLSVYVDDVVQKLRRAGMAVELAHVDYEFQRGANQMMICRRADAQS